MTVPTDRGFVREALVPLMRDRGLTYRSLARLTRESDPDGKGLTHGYLVSLSKGTEQAGESALVLLARALEISPQEFADYRLAHLRALLDARRLGSKAAGENLARIEHALGEKVRSELGLTPNGSGS
jgi:hypothetical protein